MSLDYLLRKYQPWLSLSLYGWSLKACWLDPPYNLKILSWHLAQMVNLPGADQLSINQICSLVNLNLASWQSGFNLTACLLSLMVLFDTYLKVMVLAWLVVQLWSCLLRYPVTAWWLVWLWPDNFRWLDHASWSDQDLLTLFKLTSASKQGKYLAKLTKAQLLILINDQPNYLWLVSDQSEVYPSLLRSVLTKTSSQTVHLAQLDQALIKLADTRPSLLIELLESHYSYWLRIAERVANNRLQQVLLQSNYQRQRQHFHTNTSLLLRPDVYSDLSFQH